MKGRSAKLAETTTYATNTNLVKRLPEKDALIKITIMMKRDEKTLAIRSETRRCNLKDFSGGKDEVCVCTSIQNPKEVTH